MKRTRMSIPLSFLIVLAGCCGYAVAAPYGPDGRKTQWQQPSGATVDLRVFGDEFYGRTETPDGFTVILNREDLTYYYAARAADGESFTSTGIRADLPAPAGFAKHVEISNAKVREINLANRAKTDGGRAARWKKRIQAVKTVRDGPADDGHGISAKSVTRELAAVKALAAPLSGNRTGLTILIQFPADTKSSAVNFPTSPAKIERFCNEVGYRDNGNSGSVRDYFYDQSLGKLNYTQTVTQVVTVAHPRNYYNFSDYPANKVIFDDAGQSGRMLLTDAVNELVKQGFDFSALSVDGGNQAIATNAFFAGPDSGSWAKGLWPHQYDLNGGINVGTVTSPLYINNYQVTNLENSAPVLGTFCHENGHLILDYPDLYSVIGEGVGEHCLMGSGSLLDGERTPAPIDAYLRDMSGWENVTDLAIGDFVTKLLPTTGNVAYRLRKPGSTNEYYMVENRGGGDRWAKYAVDRGIAIWHIDETVDGGNIDGDPHYGVSLMQADGRMDLENSTPGQGNRGDSQDLFDLGSPRFADNTVPNAKWWSGKKSGVRVQVLSLPGKQMKVQFGAIPPDTIILAGPNGGEVIYPDSKYPITWEANITGNVKIELYKGGAFYQSIAASLPNDGSYKWAVPDTLPDGSDYSVVISSLTNAVAASDASDALFSINTHTFPEKGVMPYGWFKPGSANRGWEVTNSAVFEGKRALVSQQIGDGKTAAIAYRSNFKAGVVSFYFRVSSEQSYDVARFYIDGVPQILGLKDRLSGRADWTFFSFPMSAGTHTLEWSYEKDTSYLGGTDAAWLDGLSLPDTTPEIAVESQDGDGLVSGKASFVFPDVAMGSSSKSRVFTIKNLGKADLTGLKIGRTGANGGDFLLGKLGATALAPGESTTFKVIFAPKTGGAKSAGIRVFSNDSDEAKFAIAVSGTALGLPELGVQLKGGALADNAGTTSFGYAFVGVKGSSRWFTIVNHGSASLKNLAISTDGAGKQDFIVSDPGATEIAAGGSTTFKVTFKPSAVDKRRAVLHIASNDAKGGTFEINVMGVGAPAGKSAPVATRGALTPGTKPGAKATTSVEVIGGRKYLALTVVKPASGIAPGRVEVSPDLLDWFSGRKHTTVLVDDAELLKVRDNTPVTKSSKRYIRLR